MNAFSGVAMRAPRSQVSMAFEDAINPGPQGLFDPLGLVADGDQETFDRLRYTEIKHGRICMLGFLHWVVIGNGITLPGQISSSQNINFADIGNGWAASKDIPIAGACQILAFVGFLELFVMRDQANGFSLDAGAAPGDFPGDFRNGGLDFGWDTFDAETQDAKRGIELNNGRAAMMGLLGLMVHDQLAVAGVGAGAWQPLA